MLATASNIGGVATITGNPQNILIGSVSGISYRNFAAQLGPVAVIGLFLDWALIHSIYIHRKLLVMDPPTEPVDPNVFNSPPGLRLIWPVSITIAVLAGFLMGFHPSLVAAAGGALLLVRRTREPKDVYGDVDWSLLVLFLGLFLIIGGA